MNDELFVDVTIPPTDEIVLSISACKYIGDCLSAIDKDRPIGYGIDGTGYKLIPNDIHINNTVPLPDIRIQIKGEGEDILPIVGTYRIIYKQSKKIKDYIGVLYFEEEDIWVDLFNDDENGSISGVGSKKHYDELGLSLDLEICIILDLWYKLQILWLHPHIDYVESKCTRTPLKGKDKIKAIKQGRKTKYVKHYYLNTEDVNQVINGGRKRSINRHCLSWYVIGHYRQYKNGHRVFIQGYWKGELRDLKRNFDSRERIVI
jgi:hypothetical protein